MCMEGESVANPTKEPLPAQHPKRAIFLYKRQTLDSITFDLLLNSILLITLIFSLT